MEAAKKVLRYLRGSTGFGILLLAGSDLQLYGFYDFD